MVVVIKTRFFKGRRRRQKSDDDDDDEMKTVVVFCVAFFFPRFKTQTRDANAPVETETRDAQRSRKHHVPRKEIFFLFFCFFVFFGLVVFLPPNKKMCVVFVCFLFFETTQERRVFSFLWSSTCVLLVSYTQKSLFRFVSFLMKRTTTKKKTQKESMR